MEGATFISSGGLPLETVELDLYGAIKL